MDKHADFPKDEYDHRYARARELMDKQGMDALLISEELNYIYFTGHRSHQNMVDKLRPYVFILPRDGEPVVLTMAFEFDMVKLTTWVEDVRPAGLKSRVDAIVSVLKDMRLDRGGSGPNSAPSSTWG